MGLATSRHAARAGRLAGDRRFFDTTAVFLVTALAPGAQPRAREPGLEPHFIAAGQLNELELRLGSPGTCAACSITASPGTPPTWATCGGPWAAPRPGAEHRRPRFR
jgi:hypothetical protein